MKSSKRLLSGGEEAPRPSVYLYTTLIGLLALGISMQLMDFGDRLDHPEGERVAADTSERSLAQDRARQRRHAAQETSVREKLERVRLHERNRNLPPPFHGMNDEELAKWQRKMEGR